MFFFLSGLFFCFLQCFVLSCMQIQVGNGMYPLVFYEHVVVFHENGMAWPIDN